MCLAQLLQLLHIKSAGAIFVVIREHCRVSNVWAQENWIARRMRFLSQEFHALRVVFRAYHRHLLCIQLAVTCRRLVMVHVLVADVVA